jgi:hypothetical protein
MIAMSIQELQIRLGKVKDFLFGLENCNYWESRVSIVQYNAFPETPGAMLCFIVYLCCAQTIGDPRSSAIGRSFSLEALFDVDAAALGNLGLWHHYAEDAVLQGSLDSVLVDSRLEAEAALEPANTAF